MFVHISQHSVSRFLLSDCEGTVWVLFQRDLVGLCVKKITVWVKVSVLTYVRDNKIGTVSHCGLLVSP